ncbi:MAG: hypothetical protein WBP16_15495 [Ferruginibacter sp.]
MEKKPVKHTSGNSTVKNIAIGVITPVLAATIIYFLGFNRSSDKTEYKNKKAATEKAWMAYVQNKGIFSTVLKQLGSSPDIETVRAGINHEIDVTVENMADIKKEPGADQRVYSSIDITTGQMKEIKLLLNKYLDDMIAYAASNPTEEQGQAFVLQLGENLKQQMLQLKQRDSLRLNTYYLGLNKDYETTLPRSADMDGGK